MQWYDWIFLVSGLGCVVAAYALAEGVYIVIRERRPDGEEFRRRRLGH